jgi:hypothetical protein
MGLFGSPSLKRAYGRDKSRDAEDTMSELMELQAELKRKNARIKELEYELRCRKADDDLDGPLIEHFRDD